MKIKNKILLCYVSMLLHNILCSHMLLLLCFSLQLDLILCSQLKENEEYDENLPVSLSNSAGLNSATCTVEMLEHRGAKNPCIDFVGIFEVTTGKIPTKIVQWKPNSGPVKNLLTVHCFLSFSCCNLVQQHFACFRFK